MRLNLIMRSAVEKGDLVYWYETYQYGHVGNKQCWKRKKSYSVKPEKLNLDAYKNLLLNKLADSLAFNMNDSRLQLSHTTTISVDKFRGESLD